MCFRLHCDASAPRTIGGFDCILTLILNDDPARGEIGSLHELHQCFDINVIELFVFLEHVNDGVNDLCKIMRWNRRCHADRDTRRAIHQKIWQRSGQDTWLC